MRRNQRLWEDLATLYSVGLYLWREDKSWAGFNRSAYYQFLTCRDLLRRRLPDEPRGVRRFVGAEIAELLRRNEKFHPTARR
jgi:hypothetical protein